MIRSKIASRFKRAKTMGFLWALLAFVLHVVPGAVGLVRAQGSRKDDIVFNSRGTPLSGAAVRVCAMPASGQPCTPLALIYSDAALTQALANPTTTDGLGNYFFYAAPGKYEIEISGPGLTTKQIPNVILPSDPTSPAFSGGISAFSLNLTGNLTVNGNTTVVGNLASGTLNLSNQATPPGAAGSGTVNLYTKTADKRLYYKDETGTEVGPVGNTGSTLTSPVTNPNPLAFDVDIRSKGPNPVVDVTRYGVRAVASGAAPAIPGITASITATQTTATLSAASTFVNGDGVVIFGAGAAHSMTTPGAPTVTPSLASGGTGTGIVVNGLTGATTYNYQIIARDKNQGLTAASVVGTTATGAASLGSQTVTLTSASKSGTTNSFVTSAAHGLTVGSMVLVIGTTDPADFDGWFIVSTVADTTHFTIANTGFDTASGAGTSATGGSVYWFNCNHLSWTAVAGAWEYYIYGRTGGSLTLLGVSKPNATFTDLTWDDFGSPMMDSYSAPYFVPTTPPGAATSDSLVTTISSGAGTTTLTLVNAASTTVAGATILFDNAPNILTAANAAKSGNGTLYFPTSTPNYFVTNSYLILPSFLAISQAGNVAMNDTIELSNNTRWFGNLTPQGSNPPAFGFEGGALLSEFRANPGLYSPTSQNLALRGLSIGSSANNTNPAIFDYLFGSTLDNLNLYTGSGSNDYMSTSLTLRGDNTNSSYANTIRNVLFSNTANAATGNSATPSFYCNGCGLTTLERFSLAKRGLYFRPVAAGGNWTVQEGRMQGGIMPLLTTVGSTNYSISLYLKNVELDTMPHAAYAQLASLNATVTMHAACCPANSGSGLPGNTTGSAIGSLVATKESGIQNINLSALDTGLFSNRSVQVNGTAGGMGYQLAADAAPTVSISGGVGPAANTYTYQLLAVDALGGISPVSLKSAPITVNGSQGVLVSWALQPGQVATTVCRAAGGSTLCPQSGAGFQVTGTSFTDTGYSPIQSLTGIVSAFSSGLTSAGMETPSLNISGGGFKNTISGTFTANRTTTLEDGSGFIPVTSEAFFSSPRGEQNVFLPGALTSTWTGSTWTADKAVTITRVQVQAKTAPAGCTTNAVVRLTDGTTPVNVTISAAANDSGAITQNYAAAAVLTIAVQIAAAGCTTSPADANVTVQYRMQ